MCDERLAKAEKELKELLSVDNPFGCGHAKRFIWRDPAGVMACAACRMFVAERLEQSTIPRATVAAALAELRASLEETSDTFDSGLESWPYDDCRIRLEKVIGGLGLVVHEDQLSETLTDSQYKEWFTKFSWLQDGVRVGLPIAALNLTHKEEQ